MFAETPAANSGLCNIMFAVQAPGADPARVVNVTSRLHQLGRVTRDDPQLRRRHYSSLGAYASSKLAQVRRLSPQ